jgi:hypothetical protein
MLSRNTRRWLVILAVFILAFLLIAPSWSQPLSAQTLDSTPTYPIQGEPEWGSDSPWR